MTRPMLWAPAFWWVPGPISEGRYVAEFYDAAVSGADHIDTRPGFAAMLERIEGNGAHTIIVETANRFAHDLQVAPRDEL
jgi:DNA invertase Pin-like site-specific DNA recombinase